MTTPDTSIEARLEELSRRLEAVEGVIAGLVRGTHTGVPHEPPPIPNASVGDMSSDEAVPHTSDTLGAPHTEPGPGLSPLELLSIRKKVEREQRATDRRAVHGAHAAATRVSIQPMLTEADRNTEVEVPRRDIEGVIGGRLLAWIGAVIVIVGIGFFVKYAHDEGWIVLTPARGCITGGMFGAALTAAGVFVWKRFGPAASVGVIAAGIGSMFASVLAAEHVYHLISPGIAFVLLSMVTVVGIVLSANLRLISVTALSMVGAYLVPFLLITGRQSTWVTPSYAVLLQIVGIATAWRLRGRFYSLRTLAMWGTGILGIWWVLDHALEHPVQCFAFTIVYWAVVHIEIAKSALLASDSPEVSSDSEDSAISVNLENMLRWRPYVASFSASVYAAGLGIYIARDTSLRFDWLVPMCGMAATATIGFVIAAGHKLREPSTERSRLGVCLLLQAGAFLLLTIGMALTSWSMPLAWFILGVAAVAASSRIRYDPLLIYGMIAAGIGTVRLLLFDSILSGMNTGGVHVIGLELTTWTAMMAIAGVAWFVIGAIVRHTESHRAISNASWCLALLLVPIGLANASTPVHAMSIAFASAAIAVAVLARAARSQGVWIASVGTMALASILAVYGVWWMEPSILELAGAHLAREAMVPLTCAVAWIVMALLERSESERRASEIIFGLLGFAFLFSTPIHERTDSTSLAWIWLGLDLFIISGIPLLKRRAITLITPVASLMSAIVWFAAYVLAPWSASPSPLVFHPGLWYSFILACAIVMQARLLRPGSSSDRTNGGTLDMLELALYVIAGSLLFTSTSLEVARGASKLASDEAAQGGALSIWWALIAVGLITLGFFRNRSIVRHVGLGLLMVVGAKVVILDLATVSAGWRIGSFVGVGLLMLAVAIGYSRLNRTNAKSPIEERGTTDR